MKQSFRWFPAILWSWFTWYLTGYPNLRVTPDSLMQFLIGKGSHIFFFGVDGVLIYLALSAKTKYRFIIALVLTSLFGAATELHQYFIPGRHMDIRDWALDTLSAFLFLVIMKKLLNYHLTSKI
jgi:VanZ family protein